MVAFDLRVQEVVVETSNGLNRRVALVPDRTVGAVTPKVVETVSRLVGPITIDPRPQEVPWTVPLDENSVHARYDPGAVARYFVAATPRRSCSHFPRPVPRVQDARQRVVGLF